MNIEIMKSWGVSDDDFFILEEKYGNLCEYAAWQLIKKNSNNNHTDSQEDIAQDLRMALLVAGAYFKRQCYIEKCLELCHEYAKDTFIKSLVDELQDLWDNKTRHGANRQKFGPHQEKLLEKLTKKLVPSKFRPSKDDRLKIDSKFSVYAKSITWNRMKALGKKITREKSIRTGMASLSEFDYLAEN